MNKNKQIKIKNSDIDKNYQSLLQELQSIINKGSYSAYKAVDNIKVQTYWQIGERIVREELKYQDRANYGQYVIQQLSIDLDIRRDVLFRIIQFYRVYPIVGAVRRQLSWRHYLELIRIENEQKRIFYENKTIQNSWGYRELHKQIKNQLYERISPQEIEKALQIQLPAVQTLEIFKDVYSFDFLEDKITKKEKNLENQIIRSIESFLSELGNDISFLGRQVPIKIDDNTHFIDLVLYHCGIPCKILVDLKIEKIDSGDIGQMNKYIGYYKYNRQYEHEKDTIGLIIGKDAGKEEMRYALGGLEESIFVATYKSKLPSEAKIRNAVKKLT
jgi:predicted nuclease of restriction endonuclease-like (RecB) superfamily